MPERGISDRDGCRELRYAWFEEMGAAGRAGDLPSPITGTIMETVLMNDTGHGNGG